MKEVRFFKELSFNSSRKGFSNVLGIRRVSHYQKTSRPPVLLLGECHYRPAAKIILHRSLQALKSRGYDAYMEEGIGGGTTLEGGLSDEVLRKNIIDTLCQKHPAFIPLLQNRYQLTQEEFESECNEILEKCNLSSKEATSLKRFIGCYFEIDMPLYSQLINRGFSYENLDKHFYESFFRPFGSRRDLNFRDEQYANIISEAYEQGKNIVSIIGGYHVIPDSDSVSVFMDTIMGARTLIAERLLERGVPSITLYPFMSSHTTANIYADVLEKQYAYDPTAEVTLKPYSIDVEGEEGLVRFLTLVDALSASLTNQVEEEHVPLSNNRP